MLVIGERINCSRKRIGRAARARDVDFIQQTALTQVKAGAHMLDVNGALGDQETTVLPWLVEIIQEATDVPLCLDSPNPNALQKALPLCRQRPIINSITAEPERLAQLLPLLGEYDASVVALCLSSAGYPTTAAERLETATFLIDKLTGAGLSGAQIFVDPAVFPVSTDVNQGTAVLDSISEIHQRHPEVQTIIGLSNVSYGLPVRKLLNQTYLVLALSRGLSAVILDPCDTQLMANLIAAETLLGRDDYCANYLQAQRDGKLEGAL